MQQTEPRDPLWWRPLAECKDMPGDLFLKANGHRTANAKAICHRCPVEDVCLFYGMSMEMQGLRFGVFGGASPIDRDALHIVPEIAAAGYHAARSDLWSLMHSSEALVELRSLNAV